MFKHCSETADLRTVESTLVAARLAGALIHPKICGTYEIGRYKEQLFISF